MVKHTGPLLGYNNNVPYKGHVYHVQTEDSGSKRPHVITHLFADGGRIVKTKKTSYAQFVASDNLTERVRALMRNQHKQMVITLRKGEFDYLIEPAEGVDMRELAKDMVETSELPASAPIELVHQVGDERDFHREMEELAAAEAAAATEAANAAAAKVVAPTPVTPASGTPPAEGEDKETTYKFVGRPPAPKRRSGPAPASSRSTPPSRTVPPPAKAKGGALPIKPRSKLDSVDALPTGDPNEFGGRFVTDRRFDELVLLFFSDR